MHIMYGLVLLSYKMLFSLFLYPSLYIFHEYYSLWLNSGRATLRLIVSSSPMSEVAGAYSPLMTIDQPYQSGKQVDL